jgi:hypothetical protein
LHKTFEGYTRALDESAAAAQLALLRGEFPALPPVLWQTYGGVMADHDADATEVPVYQAVAPDNVNGSRVCAPLLPAMAAHGAGTMSHPAAVLAHTLEQGALDAPVRAVPVHASTRAAVTEPAHDVEPITMPALQAEPDNGWPVGPAPLGRGAMAELMARMVATPAIVSGDANEAGVTKNRLAELLKGVSKAQAKELAETLVVWLDQAHLLAEPTTPDRLRHPRMLVTTNLSDIAERLVATACPDRATVQAHWSETLEGRV